MNTNKQEVTVTKFSPITIKAIITIHQVSNSYGFVDIEFWLEGNRFMATRGWRVIDATKTKDATFKLDAPAYKAGLKYHKSVFVELPVYRELAKVILPIFESCPDIITSKQIDEIDKEVTR